MKPFFGDRQFMEGCEYRMAEFIGEYCSSLSRIDILDKGMNIPMEIVWLTRAIRAGLPRGQEHMFGDWVIWFGRQLLQNKGTVRDIPQNIKWRHSQFRFGKKHVPAMGK